MSEKGKAKVTVHCRGRGGKRDARAFVGGMVAAAVVVAALGLASVQRGAGMRAGDAGSEAPSAQAADDGAGPVQADGPAALAAADASDLPEGTAADALGRVACLEDGGSIRVRSRERASELACDLLEGYQASRACVPVRMGYLDLFGRTWGCVVEGDGWVDVGVVSDLGAGAGSTLTVTRMDVDAWARDLQAEGGMDE